MYQFNSAYHQALFYVTNDQYSVATLGHLRNGDVFMVLNREKQYVKVLANDKIGFIHKRWLKHSKKLSNS